MNPREDNTTNNNIYETWKFIFNDSKYPSLSQYPNGYYINIKTKEVYSHSTGIKHIVGEDNELRIYDMWWIENG
tara:strand:+ start:215 stop:436 length:222 start_codon:yes stop_codon:yes gene_type:complete